jgi:hypothetical protein
MAREANDLSLLQLACSRSDTGTLLKTSTGGKPVISS